MTVAAIATHPNTRDTALGRAWIASGWSTRRGDGKPVVESTTTRESERATRAVSARRITHQGSGRGTLSGAGVGTPSTRRDGTYVNGALFR